MLLEKCSLFIEQICKNPCGIAVGDINPDLIEGYDGMRVASGSRWVKRERSTAEAKQKVQAYPITYMQLSLE